MMQARVIRSPGGWCLATRPCAGAAWHFDYYPTYSQASNQAAEVADGRPHRHGIH